MLLIRAFYLSLLTFLANKEDVPAQEASTQDNVISDIKIAYISFGVAFVLLLLSFMVAFWIYKKSVRHRMERSALLVAYYVGLEAS